MKRCLVLLLLLGAGRFAAQGEEFLQPFNTVFNAFSTQHGLSQSSVFAIQQDRLGFLWIGTRYGLNRFDGYEFRKYFYETRDSSTLSSNEITAIHEDWEGTLWVGTRGGGLNRYHRARDNFTRYTSLNRENVVRAIAHDANHTLWVGTSEGLLRARGTSQPGSTRFENVSAQVEFRCFRGEALRLDRRFLSTIALLPLGPDSLLVGTDAGLFLYLHGQRLYRQVNIGQANVFTITSLAHASGGGLWVGAYNGLYRVQPNGASWDAPTATLYSNRAPDPRRRLLAERVEDVVTDHQGNVWVATRGGGISRIEASGRLTHFVNDYTNPSSIQDNIVNTLLVDRFGVLWIGTESKGCNFIDLYQKHFLHIRNVSGQPASGNHMVTALAYAGNQEFWVGTALHGLNRLTLRDDGGYSVQNFRDIPIGLEEITVREVISLLVDRRGAVWIGTPTNRLIRYTPGGGFSSALVNGYVFALHQDALGNIWYGTWGNGLGLVDRALGQPRPMAGGAGGRRPLSSDRVIAIADDSYGNLWVGTKGSGLNVAPLRQVIQGEADFATFSHRPEDPHSISHNDIFGITQDSRGRIWVATGHGLNRVVWPEGMNPSQAALRNELRFVSYGRAEGLPSSVIFGITEDARGRLWLSTYRGLSAFDPDAQTFKHFGRHDGLPDDEFHFNAYAQSGCGVIALGGTKGLTLFHPDSIRGKPFELRPVLTSLKLFNRPVAPGAGVNGRVILAEDITTAAAIQLQHRDKEFTIEFSALYFANTHGLRYAYRMLGFNENWQLTRGNARAVTYTNLHEGEYTFEVKVVNPDGSWSDQATQLRVLVAPPWWRTPWGYALYTLAIVALLVVFRKFSIIGVKEKNRLQIEQIENSKLREITEAKMQFLTNISHEIRIPLTLIKDPLEQVLTQEALPPRSQEHLAVMKTSVDRLYQLVNQLLQLRMLDLGKAKLRPEVIALRGVASEILASFGPYARARSIELRFDYPQEELYLKADREQLRTILYNLLSNALKHSPDGSRVSLSVCRQEDPALAPRRWGLLRLRPTPPRRWVVLRVSDTGQGIAQGSLGRIFDRFYQEEGPRRSGYGIGLSLVKECVEMHGGKIRVVSTPGQGCVFIVLLPDHLLGLDPELRQLPLDGHTPWGVAGAPNGMPAWPEGSLTATPPTPIPPKGRREGRPSLLIAEDDEPLAEYLRAQLEGRYQVTIARDGQAAMDQVHRAQPQIIVTDIRMPRMNGIELCRRLKSDPGTSHIPVVLLTAHNAEESVLMGYESGADLYVSKPFSVKVIAQQLDSLLRSRQSLRETFSRKILLKPIDVDIASPDEQFIVKLMDVVDRNLPDCEFDVARLVEHMHMSHTKILRKVKTITGLSPVELIRDFRLKKAAQIMQKQRLPVAEIGFMVGFSDPKYFSKCFARMYGKTPTEYYHLFHPEG